MRLASLFTTSFLPFLASMAPLLWSADSRTHDPSDDLHRLASWQQAHPSPSTTPTVHETPHMLACYAAYRVTGQASYLTALATWSQTQRSALFRTTDPEQALALALPLLRYQSTCDGLDADLPQWEAWWKSLPPLQVASAHDLRRLATVAALGATTTTFTKASKAAREAWFHTVTEQLNAALPILLDAHSGPLAAARGTLRDHGEALVALASILNDVPRTHTAWPTWAASTQAIAESLRTHQRAEGSWAADLGSGPVDVYGSALVIAGMADLLDQGLLDVASFGPVIHRAWAPLATHIASDGHLTNATADDETLATMTLAAAGMTRLHRILGSDGHPLPPSTSNLIPACDLRVHPLAQQLDDVLQRTATTPVTATGLTRRDYLRTIHDLVAHYRGWQTPEGRIIDALKKVEYHYATPLYAHAAATLVSSGYDTSADLQESAMLALDVTTSDLAATATMKPGERKLAPGSDGNTSDFYIRPVMGAYLALKSRASAERAARWTQRLAGLDPKVAYSMTDGNALNWTLCLLWGEFLRNREGWQPDAAIDHSLNIQRWHMTPLGFYHEGTGPWAYDAFARYFVVGMLADGYHGTEYDFWRDAAWRGAWSSLLSQSPDGQIPIGGRSAQHLWNEPAVAAIWERYATAYARIGRPLEAGMFKRAAHLAFQEARRWIDPQHGPQITKNWFPAEKRHGYMKYSHYAAYGLLAASMLASSWEAADDAITERATAADVGGVFIHVPEMSTLIAHADGAYITYLTHGDQHYDPSGLVRVHVRGAPPSLGPSCGALDRDAKTRETTPWSISPFWSETNHEPVRLADQHDPHLVECEISPQRITFSLHTTITQQGDIHEVDEHFLLMGGAITVSTHWQAPRPGTLTVGYPALMTDGRTKTELRLEKSHFELRRPEAGGIAVDVLAPSATTLTRSQRSISHPNGVVEPLLLQSSDNHLDYRISGAP